MTTHEGRGETPAYAPIIRTQTDLEEAWRFLMEPLGFSAGATWVMTIGLDDRPTPALLEITDGEDGPPGPDEVSALGEVLRMIGEGAEPGTRWALLRSRPGAGGVGAGDRALVGALMASCREASVPMEVAHLATDTVLVALPYDELARSA